MQAALTADSSSTKNVPTITVLSATGTTSSGVRIYLYHRLYLFNYFFSEKNDKVVLQQIKF
jgi:hypothetical protein